MFRVKALRVSGLGIGSRVLGPKSRSLEPHVVLGEVLELRRYGSDSGLIVGAPMQIWALV